jgi:hypothetical protein
MANGFIQEQVEDIKERSSKTLHELLIFDFIQEQVEDIKERSSKTLHELLSFVFLLQFILFAVVWFNSVFTARPFLLMSLNLMTLEEALFIAVNFVIARIAIALFF